MNAKLFMVPTSIPDQEASDVELVARCGWQDERALRLLYRRHSASVYRFLSRLLGPSSADLDDVAQSVFLTAWRRARVFEDRGPGSVRAWLLGIAANAARDLRRSRRRLFRLVASLRDESPAPPAGPERLAISRQTMDRVSEALSALPHDLRVAFVMCELEQIPGTEAALALGVRAGTMWRRLHDARKRLRRALEEEEET